MGWLLLAKSALLLFLLVWWDFLFLSLVSVHVMYCFQLFLKLTRSVSPNILLRFCVIKGTGLSWSSYFSDTSCLFLEQRVSLQIYRLWWRVGDHSSLVAFHGTLNALATGNERLSFLESLLKLLDAVFGLVEYFIQVVDQSILAEHKVMVADEFFLHKFLRLFYTLTKELNIDPFSKLNQQLSDLKKLAP